MLERFIPGLGAAIVIAESTQALKKSPAKGPGVQEFQDKLKERKAWRDAQLQEMRNRSNSR